MKPSTVATPCYTHQTKQGRLPEALRRPKFGQLLRGIQAEREQVQAATETTRGLRDRALKLLL